MRFRSSKYVGYVLYGAVALPAFACDLPKVPIIPPGDEIGDQAAAVTAETAAYFDSMRAYATCLQDDLAAAGGDAAPASVRDVLVARGAAAVAEAQVVQTLYQDRVTVGQSATPGTEEALRKLLAGLANGTPDYDAMTDGMQRATRQQMSNLRRDTAALGEIAAIEFTGVGPQREDIYQVNGATGAMTARIRLDDEGKIDMAFLRPAPAPGERRPTARIPPRR
jgi:hypothetical protein